MLKKEIKKILLAAETRGWVLEPEAKRLCSMAAIDVPHFVWARTVGDAIRAAREIGYPVVCKVVSPEVVHKSEQDGVVVDVGRDEDLEEIFTRFSRVEGFEGMLVEEMVVGIELIVGAKIDYQFGPVILLGIGGTGVEVYKDVALRMAPIDEKDMEAMIHGLKARQLLEGYRGTDPIDKKELKKLLAAFSDLDMNLEEMIESVDLNPVVCSATRCVVADARIMLRGRE